MTKYYHIITFGCQMNISDSERISAIFKKLKYKITSNINEADLVIVTMCSVRQSAVDRVHGLVQKFSRLAGSRCGGKKPITILTGCILKEDKKKFLDSFDFVLDIKEILKIPKLIERRQIRSVPRNPAAWSREARAGRGLSEPTQGASASGELSPSDYLEIVPKYSSKFSANIPIMTGCNNFCSYCVVPYTRGREISRPAKKIIKEIKNLLKNNYKEIWLLGQNVNSYKGKPCMDDRTDKVITFPKLLKMVNNIPGDFTLNFITSHPKDFSDELIETMTKCKKLSKRLNLPIQSGDDEILKRMNRPYTVAQYKNLVKKIRKAIPDILLSTDVIVGFPGETKKQFDNTFKTLKEIGFGVAFINKYSPRSGTAAAKMKDNVPWIEKKRREKILIKLINEPR